MKWLKNINTNQKLMLLRLSVDQSMTELITLPVCREMTLQLSKICKRVDSRQACGMFSNKEQEGKIKWSLITQVASKKAETLVYQLNLECNQFRSRVMSHTLTMIRLKVIMMNLI